MPVFQSSFSFHFIYFFNFRVLLFYFIVSRKRVEHGGKHLQRVVPSLVLPFYKSGLILSYHKAPELKTWSLVSLILGLASLPGILGPNSFKFLQKTYTKLSTNYTRKIYCNLSYLNMNEHNLKREHCLTIIANIYDMLPMYILTHLVFLPSL